MTHIDHNKGNDLGILHLPNEDLGRPNELFGMLSNAFSYHFSRAWVLDLGYKSLKSAFSKAFRNVRSTFPNLRLGSINFNVRRTTLLVIFITFSWVFLVVVLLRTSISATSNDLGRKTHNSAMKIDIRVDCVACKHPDHCLLFLSMSLSTFFMRLLPRAESATFLLATWLSLSTGFGLQIVEKCFPRETHSVMLVRPSKSSFGMGNVFMPLLDRWLTQMVFSTWNAACAVTQWSSILRRYVAPLVPTPELKSGTRGDRPWSAHILLWW